MGIILDEIARSASKVVARYEILSTETAERIRREVEGKFSSEMGRSFLWEAFKEFVSVKAPFEAVSRFIREFVGTASAILFFLPWDESVAIVFPNGSQAMDVLDESFGFEFYITNEDVEYIICHNHHDYLIATGDAVSWLLASLQDIEREAEEEYQRQGE
jgi:hypothetical protein